MFRGLSLRIFTIVSLILLTGLILEAQRRPQSPKTTASAAQTGGTIIVTSGVQALGAIPASSITQRTGESQTQQIGPSQPSAGLTIVPTFDPSVPPPMQTLIVNSIVPLYQNIFTDPVTVPIYFRFASTDPCSGAPLPTSEGGQSVFQATFQPWATYVTALTADATSPNDAAALATLPAPLSPNLVVSTANGRAIGLLTPPGAPGCVPLTGFDGIVTLHSAVAFSFTRPLAPGTLDAQRVLEHEIDEVLGTGSYLDIGTTDVRPEDIWTFSAPGVRNVTGVGTRYFSLDNGATTIITLNQTAGADHGDWAFLGCPSPRPLVQDAFTCADQTADISRTSPEGVVLDVIGYTLNTTTAANVGISGRVLNLSGTGIRNARVTMSDQNGRAWFAATNAFGYYTISGVPSGRSYTVAASARGYSFQPKLISLTDELSDMNFIASP